MKMPFSLSSSIALVAVASALALLALAQHEPAKPAAAQAAPPAGEQQNSAISADHSAHASAAADKPAPRSIPLSDDFARMDTDRDGKVSAKEYAASDVAAVDMVAAGERSGVEAPNGGFNLANNEGRPDRSKFFRRLDTDGDGFLSRGELGAGQAFTNRETKK